MNTLTIPKKQLEVLYQTLKGTEGQISLTQARARDLFMKKVTDALETFYADRKKIYETFCTRDADGNPDIKNNLYTFEKEKAEEMQKEFNVLLAEEVTVEVPFHDVIKSVINNTGYKPMQGEAEMIDEILGKL